MLRFRRYVVTTLLVLLLTAPPAVQAQERYASLTYSIRLTLDIEWRETTTSPDSLALGVISAQVRTESSFNIQLTQFRGDELRGSNDDVIITISGSFTNDAPGCASGSVSGTTSEDWSLGFSNSGGQLRINYHSVPGQSPDDVSYSGRPGCEPSTIYYVWPAVVSSDDAVEGTPFPVTGVSVPVSGSVPFGATYSGTLEISLVSSELAAEERETTTTTTTGTAGAFDFDFFVEPIDTEVILGGTVQFKVTVVVLQGTPELVALRAPGSAYGVTYTFLESGNNVFVDVPPYTVTLAVSTSEYTDLGPWSFEIWADTQSGLLYKQTIYFTVLEEAAARVCPRLSLVPELPTASGERVSPNDSTSYRLSLEWGGSLPASGLPVSYSVSELSGLDLEGLGIVASFTFNPVTIYQSSVSHLLQIQTEGASEGAYDIVVVATLGDPSSGLTCSAEAVVALEVSEDFVTRLIFPTLGRVSSIQGNAEIARGESGERLQADTETEVEVGDILVTGGDSDTIIGIVSKNGLVQLWKDTATMFVGIEGRGDSDGTEVVLTLLPRATACQGLSDSALMRCDLFYEFLAESGIPERLAPEVLQGAVILSIWEGAVRFASGSYDEELTIDWILTPTVAIAPRGTDFTVEVASDGTTTVTTFEGFVEVVDLVSGDSVLLGSKEQVVLPAVAGLSEEEMSSLTTTFDPNTVARWWEPQPLFQAQALSIGLPIAAAALIVAIGAIALKRRSRRIKTSTAKPPSVKVVSTPSVTTEHPLLPRPRWNRRPRTIFLMGILLSLASFFIALSLGIPSEEPLLLLLLLPGLLLSGIVAPIKLAVDKARYRRTKRISPATLVVPSAVLTSQESKYCRYCGERLLADSVFCNHCGKQQ